jgi:aminoglycoside 3-N-acetyltransferase
MNSYRELANGFRQLNIPSHQPVLAHISNSVLADVKGGSDTLLAALLATVDNVMMPTFTFQTMVIPRTGPPNNALEYAIEDHETFAEVFTESLPSSPEMGDAAEKLRSHPQSRRSNHPIFSFCGVGVDMALNAQSLSAPWAPIQKLSELDGWVLLFGGDQTLNYTIHYAETVAGRKQFIRWALTEEKVVECPHFLGCSKGFNALDSLLEDSPPQIWIGTHHARVFSMKNLIRNIVEILQKDPLALLCSDQDCVYCSEVKRWTTARAHWIPLR